MQGINLLSKTKDTIYGKTMPILLYHILHPLNYFIIHVDIITFPESLTVRVDYQDYNVKFPESSAVKYGRFQCATRAGVHPLWLIDAVSAASIKTKLGFENVSYSVYSLPENGTFTLLYVPGYIETNNSRIRCAAFADGEIIEYSDIAYFTVYCKLYE